MAGTAIGNLLGVPVEGFPRGSAGDLFPDGALDIKDVTNSVDDDDLAQAIVLAEAATEGNLDIDDLGRRFWYWAQTNGVGMGVLTADVLALYGGSNERLSTGIGQTMEAISVDEAPEPRGIPIAEASWQAWGGSRAGNGALMRCGPLAIRWRDDPIALARNSITSAVATHWDPRCVWSCVIFNLAVAATLRGESLHPEGLLTAAEEAVASVLPEFARYDSVSTMPDTVRDAVQMAGRAEIEDITFDDHTMGYTLLALQAGLITLWNAPDFESGISGIIMAGGDTDTNGAIVGAGLGAKFGLSGIPRRWREQTARLRAGRPSMESYADALAAARG